MYRLALAVILFGQTPSGWPSLPLRFEAPAELGAIRSRLESIDPQRLADVARLTGVTETGSQIRVVLSAETSELAQSVPPWIAGFAVGAEDLVVIFPARSPGYPHDTLEDVLLHEVAHVLISRASGDQAVPRWFNEGLAMAAERKRRLQDQTQLFYHLVTGNRASFDEIDRLFRGGQTEQSRAYALAGALVHGVLQEYGPAAGSDILKRVGKGSRFDQAFDDVTGTTLTEAESEFWKRQRIWTTWVPVITSSTTLWLGIALLAVLAIYRRRQRNRQIEEQWAREEDDDAGTS